MYPVRSDLHNWKAGRGDFQTFSLTIKTGNLTQDQHRMIRSSSEHILTSPYSSLPYPHLTEVSARRRQGVNERKEPCQKSDSLY